MMSFNRSSVEIDLQSLGCDKSSAFSMSAAVAEVVLNAEERKQGYVISYEADAYYVCVHVIHYNATPPTAKDLKKKPKVTEERGRGYAMARSLVKDITILNNLPARGFTVRLFDEKRKPKTGEIV